ncbi:LamB/YcsF family protein, partial [Rhizobium leguminosarum]|uniref:LamB/YcsF family protein n=1 Tax=Rhizobium leguminosarum TaxID=384 RepID=UPI003F9CF594
SPELAILAISGTELQHAARYAGMTVFSDIFADRGYLSTGRLVPRNLPGAMIERVGFSKEPGDLATRRHWRADRGYEMSLVN